MQKRGEKLAMSKKRLLNECKSTLLKPKISKWYLENLDTKPQSETINTLETGISKKEISIREGLSIALIVGAQWTMRFEGENSRKVESGGIM